MDSPSLQQRFGKRLKKLRRSSDLTQEALAEAVGVSTEHISRIERGIVAPSFKTIDGLASVLEVEVRVLFDFD